MTDTSPQPTPPHRLLGSGDVRSLVAELGLRPSKQRGQNFVVDANTIRRIVAATDLHSDDVVLEVGPGLGSLTLGLLGAVRRVIAIEVDPLLAGRLQHTVVEHAGAEPGGVLEVVLGDALRPPVLSEPPDALVANLPYNIAVPVLLGLLAELPSIRTVLVMVQLEVAERLVAGPGSKTYGVPSVKAAWYGRPRLLGRVARSVFWPVPNVDSGLVRLDRGMPPGDDELRRRTFAAVDAGFGQRRKTLRSSLSRITGSSAASEAVLRRAGIDPGQRGEALDLAAFVAIGRALGEA